MNQADKQNNLYFSNSFPFSHLPSQDPFASQLQPFFNNSIFSFSTQQIITQPIDNFLINQSPQQIQEIKSTQDKEEKFNQWKKSIFEKFGIDQQVRYVNPRHYRAIIKMRIKKSIQIIKLGDKIEKKNRKKKYLYQSRHEHAEKRQRGQDGRFLATRPLSVRLKPRSKRGRKPKNKRIDQSEK